MKEKKKSEVGKNVGIWSDDEANDAKMEKKSSILISNTSRDSFKSKHSKIDIFPENDELFSGKGVSNNSSSNGAKSRDMKSYETESDSDDDESLVHEPLSTSKKTFVFNIKLPKSEPEPEKRKKKSKKNKKEKKEKKAIQKFENKTLQSEPTSSPAVETSIPDIAVTSPSQNDVIDSPEVTNTATTNTQHVESENASTGEVMNSYNPYFMHPNYVGPRTMMAHTMYHPQAYQMMGYPRPNYMGMDYEVSLTDEAKPPPLPIDRTYTKYCV